MVKAKFFVFLSLWSLISFWGNAQELLINELASLNVTTVVDDFGEYEDWIEIYNPGNHDINLAGYFLSDNALDPGLWQIPSGDPDQTTIPPKDYLVLWADRDTTQGVIHLPFRLSRMGETLMLSKKSTTGFQIIDSISFGFIEEDQSYGRCQNLKNEWIQLKSVTPGKTNDCPTVKKKKVRTPVPAPAPPAPAADLLSGFPSPVQNLKVNELVARNARGHIDEFGDDDDWIELYNPGSSPINVAGLYLSDTTLLTSFHRIPGTDATKTTIPAGGFLVLWADGEPGEGPNHLPFKLSNGGETVYLAQLIGGQVDIIDQIAFPKLERDVSYGRFPDGENQLMLLSDPSPASQNLPIRTIGPIWMNEFMAINQGEDQDEYGEAEDWIEFYNPTQQAIDLGGAYLTDSVGELTMHRIPIYEPDSTTVPPGGYLRFWADNNPTQGIRHIDFKLSRNGEKITLTQPDGKTIIQQAQYPAASLDASFGSLPDGSDKYTFLPEPSPGAANTYQYTLVEGIVINEVLADNESTYPDNLGEIEDWIELYNTNDFSVNVGGLIFTDSLQKPIGHRIPNTYPDSTTIPAKGFLVFWADNDPEQGVLHLDIKLTASGEDVGLVQYRNEAVFLDSYTFGAQTPNESIGRFPDGTGSWRNMTVPTPGRANSANVSEQISGIFINEILARNSQVFPDENGEYTDWVEIYNINNEPINLGGLYLTDNLDEPNLYLIPDSEPSTTTIEAHGYLIFRPDANAQLGPLHTNFQLAGAGEAVGIYQLLDGNYVAIDAVTYGEQTTDVSYGRVVDASSQWTTFSEPTPGVKNGITVEQLTGIYINELMARNASTFADEHGNYVDWIEIYNGNNESIDLAGLYFSDDPSAPRKSMIPSGNSAETTIPAKGFLVFWPDANTDLGTRHLDFQLAGSGENCLLTQDLGDVTHTIDAVNYPVQTTDVSYGRLRDGTDDWDYFTTPTPNASNSGNAVWLNKNVDKLSFSLFPNPVRDILLVSIVSNEPATLGWELISAQGKVVSAGEIHAYGASYTHQLGTLEQLNIHKAGFYFLRIFSAETVQTKKLIYLPER